jgi:CHAD domain-containing protein
MAYRFGANESLSDGFARISGELLDEAIAQLSENIRVDPVDAVHEARKAIKKERALLRLMRGSVPRHHRRREDRALRDAGRQLSEVRDAEVMLETFESLAKRYGALLPRHTFDQLRIHFERGPDWQHSKLALRSAAEGAGDDLTDIRVRMGDWKLRTEGWQALEPGIERIYRAGRQAWRGADTDRSLETWHEWRKRVKDLWYQQRLLAEVGGPSVQGQAQDLDKLADLLGEDHDLGVLRAKLNDDPIPAPADLAAVTGAIDFRRAELQVEALSLGARIYSEKTPVFVERMGQLWNAGRGHAVIERLMQDRSK